jgi:hypothetical protein
MYPVDLHMHTLASTMLTVLFIIISPRRCAKICNLCYHRSRPGDGGCPHEFHFNNMRILPAS